MICAFWEYAVDFIKPSRSGLACRFLQKEGDSAFLHWSGFKKLALLSTGKSRLSADWFTSPPMARDFRGEKEESGHNIGVRAVSAFSVSSWTSFTGALFLALSFFFPSGVLQAEEKPKGAEVTFLEGSAAKVSKDGSRSSLSLRSVVYEGESVHTEAGSRLELMLPDESVVRLGPSSKLDLSEVNFQSGARRFSAKLAFGKVWSKVTRAISGDAKFEVETDNAVAGVRGTTFRVDANRDRSVLVRVYAGAVAMAPGAGIAMPSPRKQPGRVQVAGPRQVSRSEWEVLVGKMMSLSINPDGSPGEAVAFTAEEEAGDEWVSWNRSRDGED